MPRKVFVAGEILTAADVNTNLMDQAVMVFADSTARTAAIPTPVEGMVTYLEDVGGAQGLEVFDGAAFTPVAIEPDPPGLVAVKSVTKTDTFSTTVTAAITGLSISHAVKDSANKVILIAQLSGGRSDGIGGWAVGADGTLLNIGDTDGSRVRTSGINGTGNSDIQSTTTIVVEYAPGSTSAVTYAGFVLPVPSGVTHHVNRDSNNVNANNRARSASSLILMEVSV